MRHRAALVAVGALFLFLHLWRMGELSFTWDEGGDLAIVQCLQETRNPFACLDDISQTRFPFYLHAITGHHHSVSLFFSAMTLIALYLYAHREHGALAATLFGALYLTSPAMLASGRMVLTHSHIVCTAFSTLSFLALFEYNRTGRRLFIVLCAIASGLAAASSVVAVFNGVVLLAFHTRRSWRDVIFFPVAAATFFATSIIYVKPSLFAALVEACRLENGYPFWNYLGLGTATAPWFFPFALLLIKVGPWLLGLIGARRFAIALSIVLLLKGAVFGYETPHHQSQFYPLLYFFVAVAIAKAWRPWIAALVCVAFAIQLYDVARFFPNYLFYGAQYGDRFIGEFYGPAVIHGQGRDAVWREIDAIRAREPQAKFLMADNNIFEREFTTFTKRDPNTVYGYALVDRLYAKHFAFPERDAYNAWLEAHCQPYFTTEFPPHKWVYRIMRCK